MPFLVPIAKGAGIAAKLTGSMNTRIVQSLAKVSQRFGRFKAPLTARAIELNKTFRPGVEFFCNKTGSAYKAYRRKDIDWNRIRTNPAGRKDFIGKINREAALEGHAPELSETEMVTIHHSRQSSKGPNFEASTRYHNWTTKNLPPLHPYGRSAHPVYPMSGQQRQIWQTIEVKEYWKWRASQLD